MQKDRIKQAVQSLVPFAGGKETLRLREFFFEKSRFELRSGYSVGFSPALLWPAEQERSLARITHGWIFLRGLYTKSEELSDVQRRQIVQVFESLFHEWQLLKDDREMAFHDETVAQRVINLCVFQDSFSHLLTQELSLRIDIQLSKDIMLLADSSFYAGNNNHGMFQDFGIILGVAYEKVPNAERDGYLNLAFNRLSQYMSTCFTSEGIHVENSPSYHLMVSRYLKRLLDISQTYGRDSEFEHLSHLLESADEYAAAALSPLGNFVPISDTKGDVVLVNQARDAYGDGLLVKAIEELKSGKTIQASTFVAPESGYFSAKCSSPDNGQYFQNQVFFHAAYNADYHKHSDENNVLFYLDGMPALTESGPNGYQYKDPFTKYAYGSSAHNSLVVDGRGLPRIDRHKDKTNLYYRGLNEGVEYVSGVTERYKGIKWERELRVSQLDCLERLSISDEITSEDNHEYLFSWHLGSNFRPIILGNTVLAMNHCGGRSFMLQARSSSDLESKSYRGVTGSKLQGWHFPKMGTKKPSDVVEYTTTARNLRVEWNLKVLARGIREDCVKERLKLSGDLQATVETASNGDPNGGYQVILVDTAKHPNILRDVEHITQGSGLATIVVDVRGLSLSEAELGELEDALSTAIAEDAKGRLVRILVFPIERRVFDRLMKYLVSDPTAEVDVCYATIEPKDLASPQKMVYRLAVGRCLAELEDSNSKSELSGSSFWAACSRLMRSTAAVSKRLDSSFETHTVFLGETEDNGSQRSLGIMFFRKPANGVNLTVYRDGKVYSKPYVSSLENRVYTWMVPTGSEYFIRVRSRGSAWEEDFKSWKLKVR